MTVYFIGAGIGGIDYLTVKGYRLISQAEVILYDALADSTILDLAPQECLKINVGKRGGKVSTPQASINQLLVDYAQQKEIVIRLKSGDPAIFGRINPELEALSTINASVELIPGISSVLAAPLLAGITLTEKEHSQNFTVISGHNPDSLNWSVLSKMDTLIVLMGARNLQSICQYLMANNRPPNFPIAIIKNAGRENQQIWLGQLDNIVTQTADVSLSPCVIVIGNMINHRQLPLS